MSSDSNSGGYVKRTSGAELPAAQELLDILKNESQRQAVRFDYLQRHDDIFNAFRELSKLAGANDAWTTDYANIELPRLVEEVDETTHRLNDYIANTQNPVLYHAIYSSLIPEEDDSQSDIIFVFGAATNARIEKAVELYNDGVAPKILISGNKPFYSDANVSEARRMADFAIERGIPEGALLLEEESISVPDNVKRSLDLMEVVGLQPKSITIVATNFVLQRAVMDWYKFAPWQPIVKPIAPPPQSRRFTPDGWYAEDETRRLVLNEYAKLVFESKLDLMRAAS